MRPSIARANEQLDPRQQLANTLPPQSTTPGFQDNLLTYLIHTYLLTDSLTYLFSLLNPS